MPNNSKSKKLQVIIADDSAMVRDRLSTLLRDVDGVEVIAEAHDAIEAAFLISSLKPDAVTLDVRMNGGTGFGVLEEIRRDIPSFEEAPVVIMLSNYTHPLYRRKAITAGANFFFDKSSEFDKVRDVLCRMVRPVTPTARRSAERLAFLAANA